MADKMAETLLSKGMHKISLLSSNQSGLIDMVNTFEQGVKKYPELEITHSHFVNPDTKDFNLLIDKISQENPDIILLQMHAPAMDIFMKQFRDKNLPISVSSLASFQYINNKELIEGLWYTDAANPTNQYKEEYKSKTGTDVTNLSEYFYTELDVLTRAYESFDSKPSTGQLADYLKKNNKVEGTIIGDLNISPKGYIFAEPSLLKIQNGKAVVVEE